MEWIALNWWWVSLCIPVVLGILKVAAKLTKWDGDDKIITLLAGLWDMFKGRVPRTTTGRPKKKKYREGLQ
ncbi:MAG: hypothetical protein U9Q97_04065 [Acidobacteriota bacterium]|nr:hypothetical protein [Acidobacteriota bacterium]